MSDLLSRLTKANTIDNSDILSHSVLFSEKDITPTSIPILNVALSGKIDGGFYPGICSIGGPSRHFKSSLAIEMVASYQRKYPEALVLFYDSEFGSPASYFASFGVNADRVIHKPIKNIEIMKHDMALMLEEIKRNERVIILVDSIGNLASKKESADAISGNEAEDMTRAKKLKSFFRIVTPHLVEKNITLVAIQHVYSEMGLFPKTIMSGGQGGILSSDTIIFIGRQQEKEGKDIVGYNFVLNIEKSRNVKEKSKLTLNVRYENGIDRYSGLKELAIDSGFLVQSGAWFNTVDFETGELSDKKIRASEISNDFYEQLILNDKFKEFVQEKYLLSH